MLICGSVGLPIRKEMCECCILYKHCNSYKQWEREQYSTDQKKINIIKNSKKYKCDLCLDAEDWTTGTMMLTKEEYEIVKRVTDISNWDDLEEGSWSGHFYISCEELEKDGEE